MGISDCRLIILPKVTDQRGNLTFIENNKQIPFEIKRIYYLYDVPGYACRGGHGHKELQQLIIAISGSFDVILDDGFHRHIYHLDRPDYALYVCQLMWREVYNFSFGAVCLVLASAVYDESDYYRDYDVFLKVARSQHENSLFGYKTPLS